MRVKQGYMQEKLKSGEAILPVGVLCCANIKHPQDFELLKSFWGR